LLAKYVYEPATSFSGLSDVLSRLFLPMPRLSIGAKVTASELFKRKRTSLFDGCI